MYSYTMNFNPVYIKSQTPLPQYSQSLLTNGAQVLVRILKEASPGVYTASFAGGRFNVNSSKPLSPGQTFFAKVNWTSTGINLTPVVKENAAASVMPAGVYNLENPSAIANFFAGLGIEFNSVNQKLMELLMSLGARFDASKLGKAARIAVSFKGNENRAAQAALVLMEKGIEPTESNVADMLGGFDTGEENPGEKDRNGNDSSYGFEGQEKSEGIAGDYGEELCGQLKRFFTQCLKGDKAGKKEGLLTLVNHLPARTNDSKNEYVTGKQWIIVPFEIVQNQNITGRGTMKFFIDFENSRVEKNVVAFEFVAKRWIFVVKYNDNIPAVKFAVEPEDSSFRNLKEQFITKTGFTDVEFVSYDSIDEFASEDYVFSTVKGFV